MTFTKPQKPSEDSFCGFFIPDDMKHDDKLQQHRRMFRDKFKQIQRYTAATATRPNNYLPKVAALQYDLACACWFDGEDAATAEQLLKESIDSCDRYTGRRREVRFRRIAAIEALTHIYNRTGRLEDSERMQLLQLEAERALAAENEYVYGENVAITLWHLGNLYVDMRRYKDAERMYLQTLDARNGFDGEDIYRYRPATAQCHRSLGNLYFTCLNDNAAAERHYIEAVKITEELCENEYERCNHIRALAKSLRLLADFYDRTGRGEQARPLAARARNIEDELETPPPFDTPAEEAES